jgi:hypothetical protein
MKSSLVLLGVAALVLAGCGDVRENLGLGRNTPDEFAVVDRPPLSMPPDFGLRPPKPGAPRPQDVDMTQKANNIVFAGSDDKSVTAASPDVSSSEKMLLTQTGADKADPNIRTIVDRETSEKVVGSKHLVEDLLFWRKDEKPAAVVDAPAEAERIKQAQEKNQPLNQGSTPVIEHDKSGWLGL